MLVIAVFYILYYHPHQSVSTADQAVPSTLGKFLERSGHRASINLLEKGLKLNPNDPLRQETFRKKAEAGIGSVEEAFLENGAYLRFSASTGELIKYSLPPSEVRSVENTDKGPISKEEFLSRVHSVVKYFIPEATASSNVEFLINADAVRYQSSDQNQELSGVDSAAPGPEDYWEIQVRRRFRAFDCLSGIVIRANVRTGRIIMISNLPFVEPTTLNQRISKEQAIQIGIKLAQDKGIRFSRVETSQLVVHPNNLWDISDLQMLSTSSHTRLCWLVRFVNENMQSSRPVDILVDCETGIIDGGMY
jgi:hypothetical protein